MRIIVQKYGGTSVGSVDRIMWVTNHIIESLESGTKLVVIVSAMAGETDRLFSLVRQVTKIKQGREIDGIVSTGEQITVSLLALALQSRGVEVKGFCGWQVPIVTTTDFSQARIKRIDSDKIKAELINHQVVVIAGFQGVTEFGDISTLGRGGSDTSAVAVAVSLQALECQIFTDVNGIYNADPNKITTARRINNVDGVIMLEAASLGAKVLHVRSCELAYRYKLNIRVLSTFAPQDQGSLIVNDRELENYSIVSLSLEEQQTLLRVSAYDSTKLSSVLMNLYDVCNVDMLNFGDNCFSFSVSQLYIEEISQILDFHSLQYTAVNNLTKLSLIGSGFRSNNVLNKNIWQALEQVEIFSLSHNELSVSILVHNLDVVKVRNKLSHLL